MHFSAPSIWYVVFTPAPRLPWWLRPFTRGTFGHVLLYRVENGTRQPAARKHILRLEPLLSGLCLTLEPLPPGTRGGGAYYARLLAAHYAAQGQQIRVLRYVPEAQRKPAATHIANYFPTCVTLAKLTLGVRNFVCTPRGLYRHLVQRGARELSLPTAINIYKDSPDG